MGSSSSSPGPLQRGVTFRSVTLIHRRVLLAAPPASHAVYELDFALADDCTAAQVYGQPTTHVKVRIPGRAKGRTFSIMAAEPSLRQDGDVYAGLSGDSSSSSAAEGTQPSGKKQNIIRLVVKHYPEGVMSTFLTQTLEIGKLAEMSLTRTKEVRVPVAPSTSATAPVHLGIILYGVAADEAVNCLPGMLHQYASKGLRATMILANKTKDDILFADEWRALLKRYGTLGEGRALRIVHVLSRAPKDSAGSSAAASSSSESSPAADALSGIGEFICGRRLDAELVKSILVPSASDSSSAENWPLPSVFFIVGSKPQMRETWQLVKHNVNSKADNLLHMSLAGTFWFLPGCSPAPAPSVEVQQNKTA